MNSVSDHAIVVTPKNGMENKTDTHAIKPKSVEPFVKRKAIFPEKNTINANSVEFNPFTTNNGSLLNTIPKNAISKGKKGVQSNKGLLL